MYYLRLKVHLCTLYFFKYNILIFPLKKAAKYFQRLHIYYYTNALGIDNNLFCILSYVRKIFFT